MQRQEAIAAIIAIVTGLFLLAMDGVLGVIEVEDDELGGADIGGEKLIHQYQRQAVEFGARDTVFKPR